MAMADCPLRCTVALCDDRRTALKAGTFECSDSQFIVQPVDLQLSGPMHIGCPPASRLGPHNAALRPTGWSATVEAIER